MADQWVANWLSESVGRAALHDKTLPHCDRQFVDRWVSDLRPVQLDYLQRYMKQNKDMFLQRRDMCRSILNKIVGFYDQEAKFDLRLDEASGEFDSKDNTDKAAEPMNSAESEHCFNGLYHPSKQFNARIEDLTHFNNVDPQSPEVQTLVHKLNNIRIGDSPLATMREVLSVFLNSDFHTTSFALEHFRSTVGLGAALPPGCKVSILLKNIRDKDKHHQDACLHPWFDNGIMSMIILSLATPVYKLRDLVDEHCSSLTAATLKGNTYHADVWAQLNFIPSASLRNAFAYAKAAALGPQASTTVFMVYLHDRDYIDWCSYASKRLHNMNDYQSFDHCFVLGVDPEGMVIWQSWKRGGPRLTEHVALGGAKIRSFEEAQEWADLFEDFVNCDDCKAPPHHQRYASLLKALRDSPDHRTEGQFTALKNEQFEKLFGVNFFDLVANPAARAKRMIPTFAPCVEIRMVEDVQASDVLKFEWAVDKECEAWMGGRPVAVRWS